MCCLGAAGPSPQHQAEMPAAQKVMKEPRSWHATPAEAPGGRTGRTLAVQTSGAAPERFTTAPESGCSVVRMHTEIARVLGLLVFI